MLELVGFYSVGLLLNTANLTFNGFESSPPSAIVSEFPQQYVDAEFYETPYEREANEGERGAREGKEEDLEEMKRRDFEEYGDNEDNESRGWRYEDDYDRDARYEYDDRERRDRETERIEDQIEDLEERLEELNGRYFF